MVFMKRHSNKVHIMNFEGMLPKTAPIPNSFLDTGEFPNFVYLLIDLDVNLIQLSAAVNHSGGFPQILAVDSLKKSDNNRC